MLLAPPILQDQKYHAFGDTRTIFGIPNFWNVVSNIPFLLVGILGLRRLSGVTARFLFVGVLLTSLGSAYYHWAPNNASLVWDRLPMTIVFMSFFSWIAFEDLGAAYEMPLLGLLLACGAGSILWWCVTGDLRVYVLVQFGPAVVVLPKLWTGNNRKHLWAVFGFYTLAKLAEHFDGLIYLHSPLSGHTWQHCFATASTYWILRWRMTSIFQDSSGQMDLDNDILGTPKLVNTGIRAEILHG